MAKSHSSNAGLIPAAGYLRMSSDKQETSIDDQRSELLAYAAKHGFKIVKWYIDEGVSGWKSKERQSFLSLIADAADGEFKVVLCWDQSRFSRFDPMEANFYWHQLRQANVAIETVKEGKLDFDSLGGWLTASVQQHGKAEYCRSLAADTVRGRRRGLSEGRWMASRPYGYRIDAATGKLVIGDASEVETVRRIFTTRARGLGVRTITQSLNGDRIPAPRGGKWHVKQVRAMLSRQTYIGHTCVGLTHTGKFTRFVDEKRTIENTHPAIIDPAVWAEVQAVNARKSQQRAKCSTGQGHLAGILRCGCCGRTMFSDGWRKRYICGSYNSGGGCSCNYLAFNAALKAVADKVRTVVLMGSLDALTAAIERALAKRQASAHKIDAEGLRKQIAEIDRKLAGAAARLLEIEPSLVADVQAAMLTLKEKRATLAAKLESAKPGKPARSARDIAAKLWELDRLMQAGDPATVRESLSRIIDRVELNYDVQPLGTRRKKATLAGGTIYFASVQNGQLAPQRVEHR